MNRQLFFPRVRGIHFHSAGLNKGTEQDYCQQELRHCLLTREQSGSNSGTENKVTVTDQGCGLNGSGHFKNPDPVPALLYRKRCL